MAGDGNTPNLLSIAEIAEIAEVGPSAVSNWRARKETFPRPKVDAPSGALFDFDQVEDWLLAEGKIPERLRRGKRLWPMFETLRGSVSIERAAELGRAGLVYLVASSTSDERGLDIPEGARWSNVREADDAVHAIRIAARTIQERNGTLEGLLEPLEELQGELGGSVARAFVDLLDSMQDTLAHGTDPAGLFNELAAGSFLADRKLAEFASPESEARLLASLIDDHIGSVFDPALGTGLLLLEAAKAGSADRVVGWEMADYAARVARSRFFVSGIEAEVEVRDSLNAAMGELPTADLVVIDPPFGQKSWGAPDTYRSERWSFGEVSPRNGDFAWIQLATLLVEPGGRGYVFSMPGTLSGGGSDGEVRRRLINEGVIECIITLPPRLRLDVGEQIVLWVMRSAVTPAPGREILLIDASDLGKMGRSQSTLPKDSIRRIDQALSSWRLGGVVPTADEDIAIAVDPSELSGGTLLPAPHLAERHRNPESLRGKRALLSAQLEELLPIGFDGIGQIEPFDPPDAFSAPLVPIGDLADLRRGRTLKPGEREQISDEPGEGLSRFIDAKDVRRGAPSYLPARVCEERLEKIRSGDVLLALGKSGTTAKFVDDELDGSFLGPQVWLVRSRDRERLAPEWIYTALTSDGFLSLAIEGKTVPSIQKDKFDQTKIPLAPIEEQLRIGRLLLDLERSSANAQAASDALEALQSILATESIVLFNPWQ